MENTKCENYAHTKVAKIKKIKTIYFIFFQFDVTNLVNNFSKIKQKHSTVSTLCLGNTALFPGRKIKENIYVLLNCIKFHINFKACKRKNQFILKHKGVYITGMYLRVDCCGGTDSDTKKSNAPGVQC